MTQTQHQNIMLQCSNNFPVGCKVRIKENFKQAAIRYYDFTGIQEQRAKKLVQQTFIVKGYHFFVIPNGIMDTRLIVQYENQVEDDLENIDVWNSSYFEIVQ